MVIKILQYYNRKNNINKYFKRIINGYASFFKLYRHFLDFYVNKKIILNINFVIGGGYYGCTRCSKIF